MPAMIFAQEAAIGTYTTFGSGLPVMMRETMDDARAFLESKGYVVGERNHNGETVLVTVERQDGESVEDYLMQKYQDGETGEFFMERYYTGDDPASSFFVKDIPFGAVFLSHED